MKPIELNCKFQAHVILYCKGYYQQKDVSFHEGLRRIWAVRCGHDIEHISTSSDEYIADDMYKIIQKVLPKKLEYLYQHIHKSLCYKPFFRLEDLTAIEKLISFYKNELMMLQVKDKVNKNYRTLIKLPPPQKRLFSRIVKGKFEYSDYDKVKY